MPMESRANSYLANPDSATAMPQAFGTDTRESTAPPLRRVVYVVSQFPSWSETFIVREIHALLEARVDVRIVSLKRSHETMVQADAAALLDRVHQPPGWAATIGGSLSALSSHPLRIAR